MSRIGKLPINIPEGVKVELDDLDVNISGPKGRISKKFNGKISVTLDDKQIIIVPTDKSKAAKSMWGTARSIINGMVKGVSDGFFQDLEVNGVGYRASVKDKYLNLTLGKSHNTKIIIPDIIKVEAPKQNIITLSSVNKEKLGHFVATIIKQRPPEPYKGKGIRRKGQYVQRKEGKKN